MVSTGRPVSAEAYRAFRAKQVMTRRVRRAEEPRNVSPGREITDEINADAEGAERLREARRQVHNGAVRWADTDPADTA
jgi:hypothetical protein